MLEGDSMLLSWQQDWLRRNYKSWTESPLDNLLFIPKWDTTPEKLAVVLTWTNLDGVAYEEYGDEALHHPRCHCGRTLAAGLWDHDCFCYDCWEVMKATKTWTPEMGYADEIYSCPKCGQRGAHRSFIQTPRS